MKETTMKETTIKETTIKTLTKKILQEYLAKAQAHYNSDNFTQGEYWKGGKGCCVGCLAETSESPHKKLEDKTGVPEWMHHLADKIFEGLPIEEAKEFPIKYVTAWNGVIGFSEEDFKQKIQVPFLIFILEDSLKSFDNDKFHEVKKSIENVVQLYKSGETDLEKFKDAAAYASAAADVAASDAADDGRAATAASNAAYADAAYAAYAASNAAYSAANAADAAYAAAGYAYTDSAAAYAATRAADTAGYAYAAAYATAAYGAVRKDKWRFFAKEFLKLIEKEIT
jgi:hypothetical protein